MKIKVQLWDIAGQERYALLTRSFYMYARGCIIMFDLNNPDSFENVRKWKQVLDKNTADEVYAPIPCLLVANKLDLPQRAVTDSQVEEMCRELSCVQWTPVSVKEGIHVNEAVTYLLDVILGRSPRSYTQSEFEIIDHIHLADFVEQPKKKTCKACH
ncbi:unnamed protein product [Candidula unifasciata]|uniref:Uncharacterized protein n=1 Tax=Candidula unifasciata TaxID=100452 RepID=A0A8S3ZP62_9EUPU|nr:unnamed protein product [Candidula unifasciata]